MLRHFDGKKISAVLIFLAFSLYFAFWVERIGPFPDRDSVNQFYFPFLNYLKATTTDIGNDLLFLKDLIPVEYPWGSLLMPALISLFGFQEGFLAHPFLVNVLLLAALVTSIMVTEMPLSRKYLFALALFFFPMTQIALKNFNLHSFNVLFFYGGLSLFLHYLRTNKKNYLYPSLFLFWFACAIKHMGILFFLIAWCAYLLWRHHRLERIYRELLVGLMILTAALPFYPIAGYLSYLNGIMTHNPLLNLPQLIAIGIIAFLALGLYWFDLSKKQGNRRPVPSTFSSAIAFLVLNLVLAWVISLDSSFHPILWMVIFLILSILAITRFLKNFDFHTLEGLKAFLILLLLCLPLTFYFSRLAQVALIFSPGLYLMLQLIFERWRGITGPGLLTLSFILGSNFFPSLERLEGFFGSHGFGIYARGMNTLQQNFLGWEQSKLIPLRGEIMSILSTLDESKMGEDLIMLHPYQHSHVALSLQFPDQLLHALPTILLPEQVPEDRLKKLMEQILLDQKAAFYEFFEEGIFPFIMLGRDSWSKYLKWEGDPTQSPTSYNRQKFTQWFQMAYWKFLVDEGLLKEEFDIYPVGTGLKEKMLIIIQKNLVKKMNTTGQRSKRLEALISEHREQKYPGVKIARLLFAKASLLFDQNRMLEACALLEVAARLDPVHEEISKDLSIAKESLTAEEILALTGKRLNKILSEIHTGMDVLIHWKEGFDELDEDLREFLVMEGLVKPGARESFETEGALESLDQSLKAEELFSQSSKVLETNPTLAQQILMEVLKLRPNHKDALEDLGLVESRLKAGLTDDKANKDDLAASEEANHLFEKSNQYFQSEPLEAMRLLREALKIDPQHKEALKDLEILVQDQSRARQSKDQISKEVAPD